MIRHLRTVVILGSLCTSAQAQVAETKYDLYGLALPYPMVHLVHSDDPTLEGTTAQLMADDPFLLYTLGRDLIRRQFGFEHGAFGQTGDTSIPLYASGGEKVEAPRFARDHTNSCGGCHSIPHPEPGSGQTIASTGGMGRNTPHFYGAGLIEMIGEEVRRHLLKRYDLNRNGWIDRAEVDRPAPAIVNPTGDGAAVYYGDLSPDRFGVPQLNSVFRVWYLDVHGHVLDQATGLDDPEVAGFDFVMQPFGWGRGDRILPDGRRVAQGGEATSVRQFFVGASDLHMGLEAQDPSLVSDANQRFAGRSLSGALQVDFGDVVDRASTANAFGISLDDPDGDGNLVELTEGDVDAAEFYMLNVPAPAVDPLPGFKKGRSLFAGIGCTNCHQRSWHVAAADQSTGEGGDRRFFHLEIAPGATELTARLLWLADPDNGSAVGRAALKIENVFSDFKHWDIGPNFEETRYDGTVQKTHRTAPLWGVGSTAPYGHSGQFLTLHSVIAAHGGAAQAVRDSYMALSGADRDAVLDYLRSLVLYVSDELPTDLNGDGIFAKDFQIGGHGVGYERFDPRFLTRTRPTFREIARVSDHEGRTVPLQLLENAEALYGLHLAYRRDDDGNGMPDALDSQPTFTGAGQ